MALECLLFSQNFFWIFKLIHIASKHSRMLPNSIFEHQLFKIFLGGKPPDPSSISMLHILIVLHTITYNTIKFINVTTPNLEPPNEIVWLQAIENEFSLTVGKFHMFSEHILYTQCSKLPFSVKHSGALLSSFQLKMLVVHACATRCMCSYVHFWIVCINYLMICTLRCL